MAETCSRKTNRGVTLVFPCSGGSDVGELADRGARKLSQAGTAQMYCLAGIGARVSGILKATKAADLCLAVDGCSVGCASRTLQEAGLGPCRQICVTDLGFEKGATDVTEEAIAAVARAAEQELLA